MLDLTVQVVPCPRGADTHRALLAKAGGAKAQYPCLVDPNAPRGTAPLYESADIMRYLFDTYGPGFDEAAPWTLKSGAFGLLTGGVASLVRGFAGGKIADGVDEAANADAEPIEVYMYEGSPFVKPVREQLCELGLKHTIVYVPRGSSRRDDLFNKAGRFQVPYIADPNTGVEMFESAAICDYLRGTYGAGV